MHIIHNPEIFAAIWIPFGISNMESLNRFVGSHKRYTTPTEFGAKGEVTDMNPGDFQMENTGVFLTPVNYDFTKYLHANIQEKFEDKRVYGLNIYKNGLSGLGSKFPGSFSSNETKLISGKLAYKISDCIFPVLSDQQRVLLNTILHIDESEEPNHKIQPYSLVLTENKTLKGNTTEEIFAEHKNDIEAITDWVQYSTEINHCHLYIGMAAMLCIGQPDESVRDINRHILFLQSIMKTSKHIHTHLWSIRKRIQKTRQAIKKGNYKILKDNTEEICQLNDTLQKVIVCDRFLKEEIADTAQKWQKLPGLKARFFNQIMEYFQDEEQKTEERATTIAQLTEELNVLSSELDSRLELIMTRDSMTLNIILLVMTVLSAFGVAEIVGFTSEQWKAVAFFMIPFGIAAVFYLRNFLKNFKKKL